MSSATNPLLRSARAGSPEYAGELERLARRGDSDLERVEPGVREIVTAVRKEGNAALRRYIERFENRTVGEPYSRNYRGAEALASLPGAVREALVAAADRIRRYHERQAAQLTSFEYAEDGVTLGS